MCFPVLIGTIPPFASANLSAFSGVSNANAEELSERTSGSETDSSDKVIPATVTLSVNRNQAQELVVLENTSSIHIVFVGRGEISRKLLQNN